MIIPIGFDECELEWYQDSDGKMRGEYPRRAYCQWHNLRAHINGEVTWIDVPRSMADRPLFQVNWS